MDLSAPPTTATGSTNYLRVRFFSRHRLAAKFRAIAEDIPLTLLCFWFGPLVYAASLGTVAAMLLLAACTLVAPRPDGLPIIAKSIRALSAAVPLLAWMLASAAWSPDSEAAADLTLRMAVLFSGGTLLVASFALLPLQRLRPPLIATALGLSAAGAIIAVDLASGGHLARFFRGPRLEGLDPALAYGRAATLHAILFAPILVGVLRLGRPWLAVGFALIAAIVILETWRPRLTQAMMPEASLPPSQSGSSASESGRSGLSAVSSSSRPSLSSPLGSRPPHRPDALSSPRPASPRPACPRPG